MDIAGTPPPYSVLLADRLTQAAVSAQNRVKSLAPRQDLIAGLRDAISNAARANAATVRQAEEQLAQASPERKVAIAWSLEMARHRPAGPVGHHPLAGSGGRNNALSLSIVSWGRRWRNARRTAPKGRIVFAADHADRRRSGGGGANFPTG